MFGLRSSDEKSGERGTRSDPDEDERSFVTSPLFRLSRALFGGVLAFMALDNLRNLDERTQYAESKGAPLPELSVPGASAGLLLGSVGVLLWRVPSLAATAIAGFFASITPVMHDFWNLDDDEGKQQQVTHFLKNIALFGAALAFFRFGRRYHR